MQLCDPILKVLRLETAPTDFINHVKYCLAMGYILNTYYNHGIRKYCGYFFKEDDDYYQQNSFCYQNLFMLFSNKNINLFLKEDDYNMVTMQYIKGNGFQVCLKSTERIDQNNFYVTTVVRANGDTLDDALALANKKLTIKEDVIKFKLKKEE